MLHSVQPNNTVRQKTSTMKIWWLGSLLTPVIGGAVGFAVGMASPQESDWVGGGLLGPLFVGIVVGCFGSLVCTVLSIRKKESLAWVGVICALAILVSLVIGIQDIVHSRPR